ncbi:CRP/FNR family transcriptional regulator [Gillisia mitskevichiae]|uniref:CRP/FNR family transcriptional regulator n=1 Tax=Gillisia mitskevichiae TaxID=270921 RepID=A0A495PUP7_9FLAO|nr:Crp/Fnr family transcriptional regulator [Gillisia mitskevichiae]RKS53188.1 CRP/FNR family transcriptional regulator [Gillisia mitskevichiae]
MGRGQTSTEKYLLQLKDCELIKNMDSKTAESFFSLFHKESWPKHSCILNQEKLIYHFYIILSGRIKMYQVDSGNGKELTLFLLTKNDVFDIFCLLDGSKHNAYYECLDDAKVLAVPMEDLRKWLKKHPENYQTILSYSGKQLRMLEDFASNITFTDISTRLLNLLLKHVNRKSQNLELINDLPNKEIANLIGSTRAVVNRHLQKLKQLGSIKISRKKMEIKNLKMLINLLKEKKKNK